MNRKQINMLGMPGNYEEGIPAVVTGILVNNTSNNVPPDMEIR